MSSKYLYPLDLTGTQPSNRIRNEKHTISPPTLITQSSFIVLRACPFFAHNIVLKDGSGETARTLAFGEDYILTHKSIALSMLCKKPVYASIMFNDRNYTGSVYVTYQTVGGEYNLDDYTIVEKLTRQKYIITHTSYDQIVGLPAAFPNPPHQHDPTDLVGMSAVVEKLAEMAAAIRGNKGSYGLMNTMVNAHLTGTASHSPSQVGLGNLNNYGVAIPIDFTNRSANKYTTAVGVADYVAAELALHDADSASRYLQKVEAGLLYVKAVDVYAKWESDNLYFSKDYLNANFLKKTEAVTTADVGNIVNTIVDMSQYRTRTEADGTYYRQADSDARYYTKTQMDSNFVTQSVGDSRYIQTTNPESILSSKPDNALTIENNKFYVGKIAADNVVKLYIDAINGSDNSPGTRAEPIRTLSKAHEMTPQNRSSTWLLRHYSIDQLENANFWYYWDFNHTVRNGAKRVITIYGNTWIDGAKNSEARQLAGGSISWEFINEVTRLPISIRTKKTDEDNRLSIYNVCLEDEAVFETHGVMFIKPKPLNPSRAPQIVYTDSTFFYGKGQVTSIGSWFMQNGAYASEDSTFFKWFINFFNEGIKIFIEGGTYGYCIVEALNGVSKFKLDTTSPFTYATPSQRPFQYLYTVGTLVVSPGGTAGAGALAAGATTISDNMSVVLQRPKLIRGLNVVNGVCTNITTNLTLVD